MIKAINRKMINNCIDHTLLKPQAILSDIEKLCAEAVAHNFYSVCVNPCYVLHAKSIVQDKLKVCSVIDFPLGSGSTKAKCIEVEEAISNGANEVDVVMPVGLFLSRKYGLVESQLNHVVSMAHNAEIIVKIIIEVALLKNAAMILEASKLVENCGADFVKTSTGTIPFSEYGMFSAINVIKNAVSEKMKIKAAGGIRSFSYANQLLGMGVNRIGSSSSVEIINGQIQTV